MKRLLAITAAMAILAFLGYSRAGLAASEPEGVAAFQKAVIEGKYLDAITSYKEQIFGSVRNEMAAVQYLKDILNDSIAAYARSEAGGGEAAIVIETVSRIDTELGIVTANLQQAKTVYNSIVRSRAYYQTALEMLAAGDYPSAILGLEKINPLDELNYTSSQNLLREATAQWKGALVGKAKAAMADGLYANALKELDTAIASFPDDAEIAVLREQALLRYIEAEVEWYESQGDLAGAINYLDMWINQDYAPAGLGVKREALLVSLRTDLLANAKAAYGNGGYKASIDVLMQGVGLLESDAVFMERWNYYQSFVPVSLLELDIISRGQYPNSAVINETDGKSQVKDRSGKTYSSGLYSRFNAFWPDKHYIQYNLGRAYTLLTATAFVTQTYEGTNNSCQFVMMGDGVELYRTKGIDLASDPIVIEVDVSGVKLLEIWLVRTSKTDGDNVFWLGEPVLYRQNQ